MEKAQWKDKCTQIWIVISTVIILTGCAGNKLITKSFPAEQMLHYSQLKDWDDTKSLNNYVIYINQGETIPLNIAMDTDFMAFKQDQVDIIVKQKLYFMIKMPENLTADELARLNKLNAGNISEMNSKQWAAFVENYMLYVSKDAMHWAPLYGSKAYREVLGFQSGSFSLGFMASTTGGLEADLKVKTVK
jgi:hypothetical protein